jgi:glycosyltransferase involved in cell wall biosynthesis
LEVTIFVTTFNHEDFVCDLLDSIVSEFPLATKIIVADLGSNDATLEVIESHHLFKETRMKLRAFKRGTSTLSAFSSELQNIQTDHVLGMSGDDVFAKGFGQVISDFELKDQDKSFMINVTLIHTNKNLTPIKVQSSHWSDSRRLNRIKLSLGNPGTGPGAIYPVKELVGILRDIEFGELLIEDYFIYWQLVDSVQFINLNSAMILYRRHADALGKQHGNPKYSKSIGQSVGIAFKKSENPIEYCFCFFLMARWLRHIPIKNFNEYFSGLLLGYKLQSQH